ncbi:MAG: rhomboid family intramembrane serine protease [Deltaproteobacteria bacterium]|nr:rhomboid family intramembrane serine protease [Deltaproteobacteria bacterium]
MIPLRDTTPSRTFPIVNFTIIAVNVIFFIIELLQQGDLNRFFFLYGLVPARYSVPEISQYFSLWSQIVPLFSFMFLHGGFWHLLGNMWFLYIFGDNVEDRLGPVRYLVFYLLCGWVSGVSQLLFNIESQIPTIGASGAIAGVMGAYMVLYPRSRVLTLIPIFFIPYFLEVPAAFFLGVWLLIQVISALVTDPGAPGIAWWAHIGGFLAGILFLKVFSAVPEIGVSRKIQETTARKSSPRLQVVKPGGDPDFYGVIDITADEARRGARKIVNIPHGVRKRLMNVTIPPGVGDGTLLRLAGAGASADGNRRADAFLKIRIGRG